MAHKTRIVLLAVSIFACCATTSGCLKADGADETNVSPQPSGTPSVLEGHWQLSCSPVGDVYASQDVDFSGNQYTSSGTLFFDSACTQVAVPAQSSTGTFIILNGNQINQTSSSGTTIYNVFEIDQNILYVGEPGGTDPSSRPQSVDLNAPFLYIGSD